MATPITRKQLIQLVLMFIVGVGATLLIQRSALIGRDVSSSPAVAAVLRDTLSPSHEVAKPTLTLVVFTDYQCPACKLANPAMERAIQKDGHVRIVYRDWPIFGAVSEQAARIAIASHRQGIYAKVHSRLMNERRPLSDRVMRDAITKSGGNWTQIKTQLSTKAAEIDRQLQRNRQDAFTLGLSGTPSYLAGSILITGRLSERDFANAFARGRAAEHSETSRP